MVSGTTGITRAADGSFVLEKDRRAGHRATLYCSGRDIEYRELQLEFNPATRLWSLLSDNVENPEQFLDNTVSLLCGWLRGEVSFTGRLSELAEKLSRHSGETVNSNILSKRLLQSQDELISLGIRYRTYRSAGKRLIEVSREGAGSADKNGIPPYPQIADPAGTDPP